MAGAVGFAIMGLIQCENKALFVTAYFSAILKHILSMALGGGMRRKKEEKTDPQKKVWLVQ